MSYGPKVYRKQGGAELVAASGGTITVESGGALAVAGTLTVTGSLVRSVTTQICSKVKVGATAGWVVAAADNKASMARLPASHSGATLVIPVSGLPMGATITAFGINGQIESAGGTATLDLELRKQTAAAADLSDATVASMTQISVTADAIVNGSKTGLTAVTSADVGYYLLATGTTAASTDIDLIGVTVTYTTA
jgi:hypothetical protein